MKHARLSWFWISLLFISAVAEAQPFALALNNVNASPFSCSLLDDLGTYKRLRVQATQTSADGRWEMPQECSFPGNVWRPYTDADATPIPFNVVIPPVPNTNAALWNSGNGGVSGRLSPVTNGNYYTFNVENITCNAGLCNSPHIGVLETPYLPVFFPAVTQSPLADAVTENAPVTITVTSSAAPIENVFLRYTTNEYVTTTIVPVSFTGTTGTAVIPGFPAGTTVKYYIYSTNKSQATIEAEVVLYGEIVHDMSTLDWNVNLGSNYPYTVIATSPVRLQYFRGVKAPNRNELSWKGECISTTDVTLTLERSQDGRRFSPIHTLQTDPVRCAEPYMYPDYEFASGTNYYRLKMENTIGDLRYSNVVLLRNAGGFEVLSQTPGPVDQQLQLLISATRSGTAVLSVTDASGRRMINRNISYSTGDQTQTLELNRLSSGVYHLAVHTADGVVKSLRFVKK